MGYRFAGANLYCHCARSVGAWCKALFSPVLDLSREPRFGRSEEMYSEDAYLTALCGKAAVWGFQGRSGIPDEKHVAATLKHFMGHGQPEGGRNVAPVSLYPMI